MAELPERRQYRLRQSRDEHNTRKITLPCDWEGQTPSQRGDPLRSDEYCPCATSKGHVYSSLSQYFISFPHQLSPYSISYFVTALNNLRSRAPSTCRTAQSAISNSISIFGVISIPLLSCRPMRAHQAYRNIQVLPFHKVRVT
jgi:hypothetical protein